MSDQHTHVIPVPHGMTPETAWAEITLLGKLAEPNDETTTGWASVECDGQECNDVDRSNSRHWHNDVLVEAWIGGVRVV